jgi:hypothetical protein
MLAEHPLAEDQQHEQPCCERGLNDHQRREQQRHHLQGEAQHGQPGAEQPARAGDKPAHECETQVRLVRRLLCVHRLKGDP